MTKPTRAQALVAAMPADLRPIILETPADDLPVTRMGSLSRETKDLFRMIIAGAAWGGVWYLNAAAAYMVDKSQYVLVLVNVGSAFFVAGSCIWHVMTVWERRSRIDHIEFAPAGPDEPKPESLGLVEHNPGRHSVLPEGWDIQLLQDFAAACVRADFDMRYRTWIGAGRMLSRNQFDALREWLEARGLMTDGQLNGAGRSRFRTWARGEMSVI